MEQNATSNKEYDLIIESPGRINILGEHTDYNNGFVLPTAIDKKITFKFRKHSNPKNCIVYSTNFDTHFSFDLNKVKPSKHQWENFILGVIAEIQLLSEGLGGFDCTLDSEIPIGSGISSSAALECGLAFGLNELYNLGLSKMQLVEIGQRAEHHYVGTKCGIMDQFASVMSKKDHVILLDCESLDYTYVPLHIAPYILLLLNTNVSHNLASGAYNTRRNQCESGVSAIQNKYPEVTSLRNVSLAMLAAFKEEMPEVVYDRCSYVIKENKRVMKAVEALKNNNLKALGSYMYETHKGLQHKYEVSCPELDFLVEFSKGYLEILGARMMGGGFGGCTINIIHPDIISDFVAVVSEAYYQKFKINLTYFDALPSEGTSIKNHVKK